MKFNFNVVNIVNIALVKSNTVYSVEIHFKLRNISIRIASPYLCTISTTFQDWTSAVNSRCIIIYRITFSIRAEV